PILPAEKMWYNPFSPQKFHVFAPCFYAMQVLQYAKAGLHPIARSTRQGLFQQLLRSLALVLHSNRSPLSPWILVSLFSCHFSALQRFGYMHLLLLVFLQKKHSRHAWLPGH